jgi:hypothetical protein
VAIPKYFNLQSDAQTAAEKGVLGGVRAGIQTYFANYRDYPTALDSASTAACSTSNPCFTNVLSQGGVTQDWTKTSSTTYTGPVGTTTYTYYNSNGTFG